MNNILLVTPLYPIPYPYNNATGVCHSFAKEWVRLGYGVKVIHLQPVHCIAWHLLVRFFGNVIANMVGGGNFYAKKLRKTEHYDMDGVDVYRIPVYNFIPHGRFPEKSVSGFVQEVIGILENDGFRPDVITGHMMPMEIIPMLGRHFNARICNVEHGIPKKIKERYPDYREILAGYDMYGFRSVSVMRQFQEEICPVPDPFVCYSGIPAAFVLNERPAKRENSFIYVGDLIKRKCPGTLLSALAKAFPAKDFSLVYVGDGPERKSLEETAAALGIGSSVSFVGKLLRREILNYYDPSLCMIMVSRGEAFGLVYIEAMARGCLTIASRGEGMDGVIEDGRNGFLCGAGDADELSGIIAAIAGMPEAERGKIADEAIRTAARMTDRSVAVDYADRLLK